VDGWLLELGLRHGRHDDESDSTLYAERTKVMHGGVEGETRSYERGAANEVRGR
jgi:hypothetical protein